MSEKRSAERRRPYRKPKLEIIRLQFEEAVLAACKMRAVAGPVGNCRRPMPCSTQGS